MSRYTLSMVQTNLAATNSNTYVSSQLKRVETYVSELSLVEQLWLLEWLAQRIREVALRASETKYETLAVMAGDPDIQREIHGINSEFAVAEADGLDKYQ